MSSSQTHTLLAQHLQKTPAFDAWVLDQLDLVAEPSPIVLSPDHTTDPACDTWSDTMRDPNTVLALYHDATQTRRIALHFYIAETQDDLYIGAGHQMLRRAAVMMEGRGKPEHHDFRVVLVASPETLRSCWTAAREFPDFLDPQALAAQMRRTIAA